MGCREPGRTPQHPRAPQRMGPCGLNPSGMDGGVGKPQWHRGGRGLGIYFFFSKRSTEPRSPPPLQLPSPLSTCTLQGAKAFWQAFRSGFYWFQLSCPFRRVGKLQSLKEKKKKKNKEGKESIMHPSPCCPFPLPRWPHTTHPDFPSPSNAFEAGFSRPWISPTVPAWLQSPSCSEAI